MLQNLSLLKPLVETGIVVGKTELIKRVRRFYKNSSLVQMLVVFPFSMIGKNEKGELFFC